MTNPTPSTQITKPSTKIDPERFSPYIVYVDESGDHSLKDIDKDYPVFVLACCIYKKADYLSQVSPAVQRLKFKYWGHDIVILRERFIRKAEAPFRFLLHPSLRNSFLQDIGDLVAQAPFVLIASVIDKIKLSQRYKIPQNPYEIALRFCVERIFLFLEEAGVTDKITHLVVERRGKREDRDLELAFRRICDGDNCWGRKLPCLEIVFADKRTNSSGLQIADLIARPIGRHVLNPQQPNRAYQIIEKKFRRGSNGVVEGWGLKVFP